MKRVLFLIIISALLLQGCAKVYYTADSRALAGGHKIIAVVPPKVLILPRKPVDLTLLSEQQKIESASFQKEVYSWLLKRKMDGRITVDIQDIETTNEILSKGGPLGVRTMAQATMCKELGVDAIVTSSFTMSKPMSEGAALALGLLIGVWGPTNEVDGTISIHDGATARMIFNYDHTLSSSFGSPGFIVEALLRRASRKMPYIIKPEPQSFAY